MYAGSDGLAFDAAFGGKDGFGTANSLVSQELRAVVEIAGAAVLRRPNWATTTLDRHCRRLAGAAGTDKDNAFSRAYASNKILPSSASRTTYEPRDEWGT
jgi:hypothetical protein